jgi:hypothetical protein
MGPNGKFAHSFSQNNRTTNNKQKERRDVCSCVRLMTLLFYSLLLLLKGDDAGDDSQVDDEIDDSGSETGGIRRVKRGSAIGKVLKKRIVGGWHKHQRR